MMLKKAVRIRLLHVPVAANDASYVQRDPHHAGR